MWLSLSALTAAFPIGLAIAGPLSDAMGCDRGS